MHYYPCPSAGYYLLSSRVSSLVYLFISHWSSGAGKNGEYLMTTIVTKPGDGRFQVLTEEVSEMSESNTVKAEEDETTDLTMKTKTKTTTTTTVGQFLYKIISF